MIQQSELRAPSNTDNLKTYLSTKPRDDHALLAARWDHAMNDLLWGEANLGYPEDVFNALCNQEIERQVAIGLEAGWLARKMGEDPYRRDVRDPSRAAYVFRLTHLTDDLFDSYRRYEGNWYEWVGYWRVIDEETFDVHLFNFLERYLGQQQFKIRNGEPQKVSASVSPTLVNSVKLALKAKLRTETIGWQTCTLPGGIPFRGSIVVGKHARPASADFFDPNPIPHSFTYTENEPTHLLEMLRTSGVQDDEIATVQQFFGYCLVRETRHQKALGLFGPSRSGKGRLMSAARWLVGEHNYVSKELNKFGNQFALGNLKGKLLCELPDERIDSKRSRVALSRLLKIIGEDAIEFEQKGKDSETEKLFCKIVIVSNELPQLADESGAMLNRLLIVETRVSHAANPDETLESKILSQPDELISWALRGLWSLQERGFAQPENGAGEKYMQANAPIRSFVNECCELSGSALKDQLFAAYQAHTEEAACKADFFKNLRHVVDFDEEKVRDGGKRVRVIQGISLKQ